MAKNNRKTIFCDIDGTLVYQFPFDAFDENKVEVLPGVAEKVKEWKEADHYIVLTTARPENMREGTIKQMQLAGIHFNQLVMGIGREERYLINNSEKLTPDVSRAIGISVKRDGGFTDVDFKSIGL
jgi:phosphoserine phosphatase